MTAEAQEHGGDDALAKRRRKRDRSRARAAAIDAFFGHAAHLRMVLARAGWSLPDIRAVIIPVGDGYGHLIGSRPSVDIPEVWVPEAVVYLAAEGIGVGLVPQLEGPPEAQRAAEAMYEDPDLEEAYLWGLRHLIAQEEAYQAAGGTTGPRGMLARGAVRHRKKLRG